MSQAEELLETLSEDSVINEVTDDKVYLIIDNDTRTINTGAKLLLGVESDEKSNRIYFRCPKIVGNDVDLTTLHLYVNYKNANGDPNSYLVEDVKADGDYVTFSWELWEDVTLYKGDVDFIICGKKSDTDGILTNHWNTTVATGVVLEGLETTDKIIKTNYDILEQILTRIDTVEANYVGTTNDFVTLIDQETGDNYKLYVSNGKLSMEVI